MAFASYEEAHAKVRELCVEHLGEHIGAQVAALAKPAFALRPAKPGIEPAGLGRWGGPALLNPGTPWPDCDGIPLSLFAVLGHRRPRPLARSRGRGSGNTVMLKLRSLGNRATTDSDRPTSRLLGEPGRLTTQRADAGEEFSVRGRERAVRSLSGVGQISST
ncbi:hypothetical protein [Spirillospora sp. CA-294931]|uniref:hypothetical protein n=1 Tax=Spirillospora sp. CA-294931 TaxID=3240042 RepID=UPI003D92F208